jgi:hypothetical protein
MNLRKKNLLTALGLIAFSSLLIVLFALTH